MKFKKFSFQAFTASEMKTLKIKLKGMDAYRYF